jgi:hemerythrin superfamily protein
MDRTPALPRLPGTNDATNQEEHMPNVVNVIEKDHREVEGLFSKFESSGDRSVAMTICEELDRHTAGEEKAVYPVVADDVPDGKQVADEAVEEHKEARQMIGRIRQTEDPDHLAELVGELKQAIEHHVEEEESELLPKLSNALSAGRLEEMGSEFEVAKGS